MDFHGATTLDSHKEYMRKASKQTYGIILDISLLQRTKNIPAMKQIYTISLFLIIMLFTGSYYPAQAFFFRNKIDSIQINYDCNQLVLPGESFNISVTSFHKNGKHRTTKGVFGGRVGWWRYELDVQGGRNQGGRIQVNEQLIPSKGKYIGISIIPKKQPELKQRILIPLNYETKLCYHPTNHFDKAPGCSFKGKVVSEFNNGQTRVYENLQKSKITDRFGFSSKAGFWRKGVFTIEPDFHNIPDHHSALIIHSKLNDAVSDTFDILLDYKHNYSLVRNGHCGSDGFSGPSGSPGGLGSNGEHGYDGQDGGNGENAPDIGVWSDLYYDEILQTNLLYVYAKNLWTDQEYRYLINPEGGSLTITAMGGTGGDGGNGGNGGRGGKGIDGPVWYESKIEKRTVRKPFTKTVMKKEKKTVINRAGNEVEITVERPVVETYYKDVVETHIVQVRCQGPGEQGGDGGNGGKGGFGGDGGNGGNIYLYFTHDARKYRDIFVCKNYGGEDGDAGRGGKGGSGGCGGHGNPMGSSGNCGHDGSSPFSWSRNGSNGKVFVEYCNEFVGNTEDNSLSQNQKNSLKLNDFY